MSISGDPNSEYAITEVQPREFGAGLFLPRPKSGDIWRRKTRIMELTKAYLINQGLKLNVDFQFGVDFYKNFDPVVKFTPQHESVKTMLMLYWSSLDDRLLG